MEDVPGRMVGSLGAAQSQEGEEKGNRSLKNTVMGTDGKGGGGGRERVGGG